jgi:hypothetical protein
MSQPVSRPGGERKTMGGEREGGGRRERKKVRVAAYTKVDISECGGGLVVVCRASDETMAFDRHDEAGMKDGEKEQLTTQSSRDIRLVSYVEPCFG